VIAVTGTFIPISDAVTILERGMHGGIATAELVVRVRQKEPGLRPGFEPRRGYAANEIYVATRSGALQLYVWSAGRTGVAQFPIKAVELLLCPRGQIPDVVYRPSFKLLLSLAGNAWMAGGALYLNEAEFSAWYDGQKRRGAWPSQRKKGTPNRDSGRPRRGRPSLQAAISSRIMRVVNGGRWTARDPISGLVAIFRATDDHACAQASHDTIARTIDALYRETGDGRLRRARRRRTPRSLTQNSIAV
jgi:hypothetical protein